MVLSASLLGAGAIGQVLYLEAEAAGVRATGIGCFYDDPVHQVYGLADSRSSRSITSRSAAMSTIRASRRCRRMNNSGMRSLLAALCLARRQAGAAYPEKPIRLVIPSAPGARRTC